MSFRILFALALLGSTTAFSPIRPLQRRAWVSVRAEQELNEEEVEEMETRKEADALSKKLRSNMYNENGVAYAPWMINQIDEEAYEAAKIMRKQRKAAIGRAAVEAEGAVFSTDLQGDELSGQGMKFKFVGDEVELAWKTGGESNNIGYRVQKRAARSTEWVTVASETLPALQSKGAAGGQYFFIDPTTSEGDWIYRIVDVENGGRTTVLCQALIEVKSKGEKTLQTVAIASFAVIFGAFCAAGYFLDPVQ
jgi:hypothetical protein